MTTRSDPVKRTTRLGGNVFAWIGILTCLQYWHSLNADTIVFYDVDLNGRISSDEYRRFLIDQTRVPLGALDGDDDGKVSDDELRYLSEVLVGIDERVAQYLLDQPDGLDTITFRRDAGLTDPPPVLPPGWLEQSGILIRGRPDAVYLFDSIKPLDSASTATIAFSRDVDDDQSLSTVKGVIMRPISLGEDTALVFLPSLAINQVKYRPAESRGTDTLVFRAAVDRLIHFNESSAISALSVRGAPALITDSHFDSRIVSAEMQLQPDIPSLGTGDPGAVGAFMIQWRPLLLGEYGRVIDGGDDTPAPSTKSFGRIGPSADLDIWFAGFDQIKASLSWQYLARVDGDSRDRKRVEAGLTLALDRSGHVQIQINYLNGDSTAKLENEKQWTLGLGVKY